jgi:hypothetical protein
MVSCGGRHGEEMAARRLTMAKEAAGRPFMAGRRRLSGTCRRKSGGTVSSPGRRSGGADKVERHPDRVVRMGRLGRNGRRFYGTRATAGRAPPRPANHGAARSGLAADRRAPHVSRFPHFQKFQKTDFRTSK